MQPWTAVDDERTAGAVTESGASVLDVSGEGSVSDR